MKKHTNYSNAVKHMYRNLLDTQTIAMQNMATLEAMLERYQQIEDRFQAVVTFRKIAQ